MASELLLRQARPDDVAAIVDLVNRAYRPAAGASGWTHEAALVAGARTSAHRWRHCCNSRTALCCWAVATIA